MKYIKQGLITANVWKTEDESKHNVQLLKLDECINTYYYQWTDIYLTLGIISEKAMAPHSSTLAWKIPWTEEPGRLQSMGSLMVRHDWATSLSLFPFMHWRRKWQPTPVFLPQESQRRRSLVGCHLWDHTESGHDWSDLAAAGYYLTASTWQVPWKRGNGNPPQFLPGESLAQRAVSQVTVREVAKSWDTT